MLDIAVTITCCLCNVCYSFIPLTNKKCLLNNNNININTTTTTTNNNNNNNNNNNYGI